MPQRLFSARAHTDASRQDDDEAEQVGDEHRPVDVAGGRGQLHDADDQLDQRDQLDDRGHPQHERVHPAVQEGEQAGEEDQHPGAEVERCRQRVDHAATLSTRFRDVRPWLRLRNQGILSRPIRRRGGLRRALPLWSTSPVSAAP